MASFGTGDYQYEVVEGWGMIPQLGLVSGVACDSNDRVYVYNRSPQPAMPRFRGRMAPSSRNGVRIFFRNPTVSG